MLGLLVCSLGPVHGGGVVHGCDDWGPPGPGKIGSGSDRLDLGNSLVRAPTHFPPLVGCQQCIENDAILCAHLLFHSVYMYVYLSLYCSTGGVLMAMIQCVQVIATRACFVVPDSKVLKRLALTNRCVCVCVFMRVHVNELAPCRQFCMRSEVRVPP